MLQLFIWINNREVVDTSRWDDSSISKILVASDYRKSNVMSQSQMNCDYCKKYTI